MKAIFLLAASLVALSAVARTAADFFVSAPKEAIPLLTTNNRLDMLDYFHTGVETATSNVLNGKSRVTAEDSLRLIASLSDISELQVAVLPNKGDTIVAFIETVASPVKDSGITFYRASDWRRLPDVDLPGADDFIAPRNRQAAATAEIPSIFFIGIDYDPEQQLILISNNSFDNLPAGERPRAALLMESVQAYRYDGKKLVRVKDFKEKVTTPAR